MDLMLLAAEAAEGGGGVSSIVVISMIVALAAFAVAYVVVGPGRRKQGAKRHGDIPLAMRPYHSDEELETTGMERAMAWGVALALFCAVFVAFYWVIEPERMNEKIDDFYAQSVAHGRGLYAANCASCHGGDLRGGSAPNPYDSNAPWPAPSLADIQSRFEGSTIVVDVRGFLDVTIKQGRPGTPMPAWGAAFLGPLNDFEVDNIVNYILSVQEEYVPPDDGTAFPGARRTGEELWENNCARCHGADLEGQVGPQLQNVFERYGYTEGDEVTREAVAETIRGTVVEGRYVPTGAIMPPFDGLLSDADLEALIDYIYERQVTGGVRYGQVGGDPVPPDDEDATQEAAP